MKRFNNFQKRYLISCKAFSISVCSFFFGIALSVLLISETWYIVQFVYKTLFNKGESYYGMLGELLIFFMYFEFIALIIKYFKSNFHFPLRYFIYIGITAVIRLIIIDHEEAVSTFWWALAILAMTPVHSLSRAKEMLLKSMRK
ncbi:protein PsiE [Bacillus safensis]|uniref:Protein PsiE n=1 Tax=Bacillus safensis TaxID=561879 RepID=A0A5S9MKG7_BACIA|nr:protein PsiE [Bacillus safensis]